jgi:predicted Zn-dependent protease
MDKRLAISVLILLGITSCATPALTPVGKEQVFQLQEDERRIWNRSAEEQERLDRSGHIYEDPLLTGYVNEVAQRLVPEDVKGKGISFQIRVIKNPLLNAFTYPNGVIYVHTGILTKMENEAQLATLLGHEMTHATHRHTIHNFRNIKQATAVLATIQVAAIPFGAYGDIATLLGSIGAMAAVTGYSRDLEREADRVGLDMLVKAGYDPEEAPRLFEHIKKDLEEQEIKEPFFFGSHPRIKERIDSYTKLLETSNAGEEGDKGTERFMEKIRPLLLDNALLDLSMGRFSSAQKGIERFLEVEPQSARGHYCLGELYRQRSEEGDREKAEEEYRLAARYDPSYPEPHKMLGLIYYKEGQWEEAREELELYLSLAPDAQDRGYIEQYLQETE